MGYDALNMKPTSPSGTRLSLLLLTHRPQDAVVIRKTLSHVYPGVEVRSTPDEKALREGAAAIAFIDTQCIGGAALCHLLDGLHAVPTILIAADLAEVRRLGPLLSGRRVIVTRGDIEGMGLIGGVHHLLERQMLSEQLARASRHLKELSIRDELTKLYNHRHLEELLATEVKKANRYRRPLGFVIISLKNFTAINETHGHSEGDRILSRAADLVRQAVREVDIPARYGDNEFAVILPESDETAAAVVGERIQKAFAEITVPGPEGEMALESCCGIAALSAAVQTKEELLRTALGALLEAKRGGHNAICTSGEMAARRREVRENRQLIEQLHERIDRIGSETERTYFQSVMKAIGEIPTVKKVLMPHSERVAFFAQRLAESLGLPEAQARSIHRSGLLHDAGKLAIDAAILAKPGKLTGAEHDLMRQHPLFAVQILGSAPFFTSELPAILHHHERIDGTGYPEGVSGEAIPLPARILSIAEAWDTMVTAQPYRPEPLPFDAALAELRKGSGRQFDPDLAERFAALIAG